MNAKYFLSLSLVLFNIALAQATSVCDNKHLVETTKLVATTGVTITMQRFNCSSTVTAAPESIFRRETPHTRRSLDPILKRSAAQCTQTNCICGIPLTFIECLTPVDSIKASDCSTLGSSLLNMNAPSTFFIPSGELVAFVVNTCETVVTNPISAATEYCFSDMGIATLQNSNPCSTSSGRSSGTFMGDAFFLGTIFP